MHDKRLEWKRPKTGPTNLFNYTRVSTTRSAASVAKLAKQQHDCASKGSPRRTKMSPRATFLPSTKWCESAAWIHRIEVSLPIPVHHVPKTVRSAVLRQRNRNHAILIWSRDHQKQEVTPPYPEAAPDWSNTRHGTKRRKRRPRKLASSLYER